MLVGAGIIFFISEFFFEGINSVINKYKHTKKEDYFNLVDRAKKYIGVEADKRMLNIALAVNKRYKNRTHIHNNAFHSSSGEDIDFYPVENLQHSSGGSLFSRAAPIKQGDFLLSPEKETALSTPLTLDHIRTVFGTY